MSTLVDLLKQQGVIAGEPKAPRKRKPAERPAEPDLHLTDRGNAQRLVVAHGRDLRYCPAWGKWLLWDGTRWQPDETGRVDLLARGVIADLYAEAARKLLDASQEPDPDRRKAQVEALQRLQAHALHSEPAPRLEAMVRLTRAEAGVPILPRELDADGWLLNCTNGTLDLRTGTLRTHRREDLLTKLCPTPYDPAARCPTWEAALSLIFGERPELVDFFRRLVGYCLTGSVREQCLPIPWGDGSNGKSLLVESLLSVLGPDYATAAADDLLMANRRDSHPTAFADLHGKRLVIATETEEGRRLNESLVKRLTGGDTVKARRLYKDHFEFAPTHKLWLVTNHKPDVRGTDHGIWRRLRLIPFTTKFWDADRKETGPPHLEADKCLKEKLAVEASGVLAWAVRGCLEWQAVGLREPPEVMAATSEFRGEMDSIARFLSECCHLGPELKHKASAVYERYKRWHKEQGEDGEPVSMKKFGSQVRHKGIESYTNNGTWYSGVMLSAEAGTGRDGD